MQKQIPRSDTHVKEDCPLVVVASWCSIVNVNQIIGHSPSQCTSSHLYFCVAMVFDGEGLLSLSGACWLLAGLVLTVFY